MRRLAVGHRTRGHSFDPGGALYSVPLRPEQSDRLPREKNGYGRLVLGFILALLLGIGGAVAPIIWPLELRFGTATILIGAEIVPQRGRDTGGAIHPRAIGPGEMFTVHGREYVSESAAETRAVAVYRVVYYLVWFRGRRFHRSSIDR